MNHLHEDVVEFRNHIARWVDERLVPVSERLDADQEFSFEFFKELGELGYLGTMYPEAIGGSGLANPYTAFAVLCEELSRGSMGFAAGVCMHSSTATNAIYEWGARR